MSIRPQGYLALAVVFACLMGGVRDAAACTCGRPENASNITDEELRSWRFDRAKIVVSGRVTDVRASVDTTRAGRRVVVGHLNVSSVLKGDVPLGDVTVLTGFGVGDCGLAEGLLVALAQNRDLTVELQREPEFQGEYTVNICGFGKLSAGHEN